NAAEQMAGTTIRSVRSVLCGGSPVSLTGYVETGLGNAAVSDADVAAVQSLALEEARAGEGMQVLHAIPLYYALDDQKGIRDPRGLYGSRLGLRLHTVAARETAVRNLSAAIALCHLDVDDLVLAPWAAGLACLTDEEREIGTVLVDMGSGTTSVAVFSEGKLVHADSIPVGGQHVTTDIARGLTTSLASAERLKTLYGHAMPGASDSRESISYPLAGEEGAEQTGQVSRAMLVRIIHARLEETLGIVRQRLLSAGFSGTTPRRVVLTGGACQLPGLRDLVQTVLEGPVRMGGPPAIAGLPASMSGPAFSAVCGLVLSHAARHRDRPVAAAAAPGAARNWMGRVGQWLRENL
ncbi:MAG: cell division protein FtsA, partial [Pseudomonadota bacterium]|nr:cell division protein FtsA [Pseudomonadota bacterium]